ncbi:hypothetical protein FA15DRAFT_431034 [Coprinopsis marcescibilis]|uniref:Uncharacterized protein n=1 Tax=Coprinopsis marcescibilis TaxID=230819 RepID=A0A5C3L984_COPMA|nr:hypothetical protein FA15DRAFT_431034 [Coprinopsis marcescibilis]
MCLDVSLFSVVPFGCPHWVAFACLSPVLYLHSQLAILRTCFKVETRSLNIVVRQRMQMDERMTITLIFCEGRTYIGHWLYHSGGQAI